MTTVEQRDLLVAAAGLVIGAQEVSYSALQRRLRLNFARAVGVACALEGIGVVSKPEPATGIGRRTVLMADFDRAVIERLASVHLGLVLCCDLHNQHCEPPSELCCHQCTERAHDTFPTRHADGSRCVLDTTKEGG